MICGGGLPLPPLYTYGCSSGAVRWVTGGAQLKYFLLLCVHIAWTALRHGSSVSTVAKGKGQPPKGLLLGSDVLPRAADAVEKFGASSRPRRRGRRRDWSAGSEAHKRNNRATKFLLAKNLFVHARLTSHFSLGCSPLFTAPPSTSPIHVSIADLHSFPRRRAPPTRLPAECFSPRFHASTLSPLSPLLSVRLTPLAPRIPCPCPCPRPCTCATHSLGVGDSVACEVDYARRGKVAPNHTMTHALNFALRQAVGEGVDQKGSLVTDEKLRWGEAVIPQLA